MKKETKEPKTKKYFAVRVQNYQSIINVNIESYSASEAVDKFLNIYKAYYTDDSPLHKSVKELSTIPKIYE